MALLTGSIRAIIPYLTAAVRIGSYGAVPGPATRPGHDAHSGVNGTQLPTAWGAAWGAAAWAYAW